MSSETITVTIMLVAFLALTIRTFFERQVGAVRWAVLRGIARMHDAIDCGLCATFGHPPDAWSHWGHHPDEGSPYEFYTCGRCGHTEAVN